ncbi:putative calcium-transporting ATPase 11, plasma membrane-type isoform X1 [Olea europaea var. sylvestris]|uniref:putative calcium-transporting ATPase 11, plasma membrane-type isoform X1 n=2 Tax=Olea europaea var. sylvestris TaxID=158386 RepID=UPI000C1D1DC7|nr:putative calcium-transporting ATPase 11, plasma membrane-type isoform X1 [Olea europaea var. sylvestris]
MEKLIPKEFDLSNKDRSDEALMRWRKAVGLVKNRRRRFRYAADLAKRSEAKAQMLKIRERLRVCFLAYKAAFRFIEAGGQGNQFSSEEAIDSQEEDIQNDLQEEAREAGFQIHPNKLASLVASYDITTLRKLKGVEGLASRLNVTLDEGVDCSSIPIRKTVFGSNEYTEKPSKSLWLFLWDAMHDTTLIILTVCAVVSIGVGLSTEGWPKGMYDGLGIILSVFLVVLVTAVSDYRQSLQFKELDKEKKKIFIHVTRDGTRQKVSIHDLVVGDIVYLSIGDQVPADGIFISGYNLLIDQSSLTGESLPINIYEKRPFLLTGTTVQDGSGKMLVTTVGMRTEWGKLLDTLNEGGEDETPLQVKLNGVATIIGKIGLAFAVMTFLVLTVRFLVEKGRLHELTQWSSRDALTLLNYFATAVTIIVVAVPEGLPLAVTLSLAFAMKKLLTEKALVRHLSACETMGSATCISTDKTGTLTTNHMVVNKVWICGKEKEVDSNADRNALDSDISGNVLAILLQAIFNNTGSEVVKDKTGKRTIFGTPTESALLEYGLLLGGDFYDQRRECKLLKVEPFNSHKKMMSTLVALGNGKMRAFCKGASEIILKMCDKTIDSNGEAFHLSEEHVGNIMNVINAFAGEALRTLCLAFKDIEDGFQENSSIPDCGYTLITIVGIKDPVRPGVKEAVKSCVEAGIYVRMITGDNINTAKAIAKECGILNDNDLAVEGPVFRLETPEEMSRMIPNIRVMARSSPLDKHVLVQMSRKELKEVVAVTGDGTNDAPALHEADIGFAMGIAGTEVAKESADVIVMNDNFTTIVNVAKWGRSVYINIQKFVQFQLTVNIVALMINFISACISGSAPLTAVQLLWVNLIMDTLGALALATEPPHDGLMKRPPVRRTENFITTPMWRNIIGQSIYQLAILLVLNFDGKKILGLEGSDASAILNTFIFNTFVFCQVFNEINSREIEKINIFRGILRNWIFTGIIASTVVFQVIIVEFLGTFASTVPLNWQLWILCVALGAVSMPIAVVLKCIPVDKKSPNSTQHDGYDPLPSGPELA